ncbi:MAG: ATP-binding protein, partial [Chloroflexota bacterium]|nr:ATP-binding protein [Chloroflexota bacterium]
MERLVAEGEGPLLEFKPADARPVELATTLAALANAEGGTLIVGVREQGGRPIIEGVPNPKLTLDHLYTAAALCSPRFDLLPPERVEVAGRLILVAVVPEGLRDAYSVEGRFVARGGSFRRALDADEIRSLLNSRGRFAYD